MGPVRTALLEKLGLRTAQDMLYFFPRKYEDRRNIKKISEFVPGAPVVAAACVASVETKIISRARRLSSCVLTDGSGTVVAVWFNRRGLERALPPGTRLAICGVPEITPRGFRMTEPEYEKLSEGADPASSGFAGIIPVYASTEGLPRKWFRALARTIAQDYAPLVPEILPQDIVRANSLIAPSDALREMHIPESPEKWKEARRRIAYEELFVLHLALALKREKRERGRGVVLSRSPYADALVASLPFGLTASQRDVIDEIFAEGAEGRPIARLLQGDVGSGKTLVSLMFAAGVCGGGAQCAMLAPTEILAEQLYTQAQRYLAPLGLKCVLLTSCVPGAERRAVLEALADGTAQVAAGTQSLLSREVKFRGLGAVVIDEQQRFGVRQRMRLLEGNSAHLLMMSATPIPRTMALTLYGDLDISIIKEKPACRTPVQTRVIESTKEKINELLLFIVREIRAGGRVYWICPRVEDDEGSALPAAQVRYAWLSKKLPPIKIALIHGKMQSSEKDDALEAFRTGRVQMLVGTTVLEVGIDVPEASVIVIESPERYGLAQLHQLRGRVGRGARRGVCVLISSIDADSPRLAAFAATDDGFAIAEEDLKLRGTGEFTGTLQHGEAELRVADLHKDALLAEHAARDVREYLKHTTYEEIPAALRRAALELIG